MTLAVIHINDGQLRCTGGFIPGFMQKQIVHVVVVERQAGAVLINLRAEIHLRDDGGVYRGELFRQQTDFIERAQRLLAA